MAKIAKNSQRGGSKPGERRGGRRKGSLNRRTEDQIAAVQATGMLPLDYLKSVYQDETVERPHRIDAAKAAAPYCHAKLIAVESRNETDISLLGVGPLMLVCREEK